MTKRRKLRQEFRKIRRALPPDRHAANANAVARYFFRSGLAMRGQRVGAYLCRTDGRDGELDLTLLLNRLISIGKRIAVPVIRRNGAMEFYNYDSGLGMIENRFQIPEPDLSAQHVARISQNIILAPLVAFDESGTRLGMGGGYYDRYLGSIDPRLRPLFVGIAHDAQRSQSPLPCETWDIRLDGVITETGWQSFHKGLF